MFEVYKIIWNKTLGNRFCFWQVVIKTHNNPKTTRRPLLRLFMVLCNYLVKSQIAIKMNEKL